MSNGERFFGSAKEYEDKGYKIFGVRTGIEGLDELFWIYKIEDGKPKKEVLKGIPYRAVVNVTGIPDTGKSLMAEQFAITQASLGYPVAFVTVETPPSFLVTTMKNKAELKGLDWDEISDNIIIIDAATKWRLRRNLETLKDTITKVHNEFQIKNLVIDSITGLYEHEEPKARMIVRELYDLAKSLLVTAMFISQKRSAHDEASAEAAGGYAVAHIVDCTIVITKRSIETKYESERYKKPIGDVVRLLRIDGCRLCGHDTQWHIMEITPEGFVRVGPSLSELAQMSST
ncbi:MAG: KaiC domain-containing protein [Euryarchaeota archaeon]|nr:KaiC domain-containing protein [Euryarchaeota archaeon]